MTVEETYHGLPQVQIPPSLLQALKESQEATKPESLNFSSQTDIRKCSDSIFLQLEGLF